MKRYACLLVLLALLGSAALAQDPPTPTPATEPAVFYYFYTYIQPSGNRLIPGTGTFPNVPAYDITLDSVPQWVVGSAIPNDIPRWQVRDALGYVAQVVRPVDSDVPGLLRPEDRGEPASALPVFVVTAGAAGNLKSQDNPTNLTHPIPVRSGTAYVQVTYNGDMAVWRARDNVELARIPVNAVRDARLVTNQTDLIAVYAGATNQRYVHGVLGDDVEGSVLLVFQLSDTIFRVVATVQLDGENVFEGVAPIWADVNEDGIDDLITTVSNSTQGSQIRVYLFDGQQFTGEINSPAIGQGGRWWHQIAWGPFGPAGENELVAVRSPHVDATVQFLRLNPETNTLDVAAEITGFTSHVIGTRNLDMAVAGDFNGDGQPELVIPSADRTAVAGIQHTAEGAQVVWSQPLDGRLVTNLAPATLPNGALALAGGLEDGRLRLWLPDK
jgi:hypothetical protein